MFAFRIGTCRIQVDFTCFALLAFCCLFAGFTGSAFALWAALLHEAAHIAALFLFDAPPQSAILTALGCRIVPDREKPLAPAAVCLVSLAGPVCNLTLFALLTLFEKGASFFAGANLALGCLHILPIEPLDGGLALRTALSVYLDPKKAAQVTRILSVLLLLPLSILGFLVLLRTRYNFSLLALSLYFMLYLVLGRDYLPE